MDRPPPVRELREEVRYRHKLSRLRARVKSQVHQVLGKEGVFPEIRVIWGPVGQRWLKDVDLADAYTNRGQSLRDLIEVYDREIDQALDFPRPLDVERSNQRALDFGSTPQYRACW